MTKMKWLTMLSFWLGLFTVSDIHAQVPPRKAEFPGGLVNLYRWIDRNMNYPEDAKAEKIEGRVVVSFIIKENGEIWNESIQVTEKLHPSIDKEAVRLLSESPMWVPARDSELGKAVPVRMTLPINFVIPKQ